MSSIRKRLEKLEAAAGALDLPIVPAPLTLTAEQAAALPAGELVVQVYAGRVRLTLDVFRTLPLAEQIQILRMPNFPGGISL